MLTLHAAVLEWRELRAAGADWVALIGTVAVVLAVTLLVSALVISYTAFAFRIGASAGDD